MATKCSTVTIKVMSDDELSSVFKLLKNHFDFHSILPYTFQSTSEKYSLGSFPIGCKISAIAGWIMSGHLTNRVTLFWLFARTLTENSFSRLPSMRLHYHLEALGVVQPFTFWRTAHPNAALQRRRVFNKKKRKTPGFVACQLKFIPVTSIRRIKHDNWKCKCGARPHILIHYNAAARGVAARWI